MCEGRVAVIQGIHEDALKYCPDCGLEVRRVISQVQFKLAGVTATNEKAGRKGLTTFKKSETGVWEKIDGPGPAAMVASKEDIAAVQAEKSRKILNLDE
jgi:predicted nucleic acid-binding Zn ribbon protein